MKPLQKSFGRAFGGWCLVEQDAFDTLCLRTDCVCAQINITLPVAMSP